MKDYLHDHRNVYGFLSIFGHLRYICSTTNEVIGKISENGSQRKDAKEVESYHILKNVTVL